EFMPPTSAQVQDKPAPSKLQPTTKTGARSLTSSTTQRLPYALKRSKAANACGDGFLLSPRSSRERAPVFVVGWSLLGAGLSWTCALVGGMNSLGIWFDHPSRLRKK